MASQSDLKPRVFTIFLDHPVRRVIKTGRYIDILISLDER
jgi:hypothetical protein